LFGFEAFLLEGDNNDDNGRQNLETSGNGQGQQLPEQRSDIHTVITCRGLENRP